MVVIHTSWWSLLTLAILEVALVLATDAQSDNETTGDLALQILSVSSTTVNFQWNCASTDNIALTWKGTADNTVETWHRKDKKVFELCQTANISQSVQAVITDLEEGVEYSLSVTQSETGLNFKTLTSVPSGPPIYLRGHSINRAGLNISWSRPKLLDCNGDILQYKIVIDNGLDDHSYIVNVSSENASRECKNIECMSHSFTVSEIDGLIPHEKYSVKVAAVNVNGTGPFSDPISVMSGDNEPGPPENLRVIHSGEESDEFILQWDIPRNPNGVITRYKVKYGITNDTRASNDNYTSSTNYTLHLLNNETYTIAVYAKNSIGLGRGVQIQWSLSDDSSSNSNRNKETYTYIIIGNSVGAVILILVICFIVMCIISRCKKSKNSPSRSKSTQFYPAEVTTVVNPGYIYAERGSNSLPYDYPYIEANGAQALSTTTFQVQNATKLANRNSTGTCGYIEMSSMLNGNVRPNSATQNPSSNISSHTAESSLSNSASYQYVNANHVPASQDDARAVLSPPAVGNGVSANANTHNDNGYVTLRS